MTPPSHITTLVTLSLFLVHKFRRRPQYLEFFVHLASVTMAKGHPDRVVEWGQEAFAWLTRSGGGLCSQAKSPVLDLEGVSVIEQSV